MIVVAEVWSAEARCDTCALKVHSQILRRITLHLRVCGVGSLRYRILKVMTLSYIGVLGQRSKLLRIFKLWIMWFSSNERQIMISRARSVLHRELAPSSACSIDHLMILIIVPLSVYLMTQVLLIQIVLLVTWYCIYHVWSGADMRVGVLFELHMVILSRGYDCFFRVRWTHIVVLVSLSACNSVCSCSLILILDLVHHLRLSLTLRRCIALPHEAQWSCSTCIGYNMIFSSSRIVKRNMNSSICISWNINKLTINQLKNFILTVWLLQSLIDVLKPRGWLLTGHTWLSWISCSRIVR